MRRWIITALTLFLAGGALGVAVLVDQAVTERVRGIEYPLRDYPLPYRIPRSGVNVDLTQYTASELEQQLALLEASGFIWLRQLVDWSRYEPTANSRLWQDWDRIAAALAQRPRLSLVPVFYRTPPWAAAAAHPYHPTLPPDDPAALAAFAGAFADRYGHLIRYYQIWDEPNLYDAWGRTHPSPAQYTAMLHETGSAIRAADPGAQIIAAALAPTTEDDARNISDWTYLRQLYALGAQQHVDAFAAKPYGFDTSPLDRTVRHDVLNFSRVVRLREIMRDAGDAERPLWLSEMGWNALPADWDGAPSIWGAVSDAQRTAYTLDALRRIESEWPFVGAAILSDWQPALPADDPRWGFALLNPDGSPTSLLQTLQQQSIALLPSNGLFPVTVDTAHYSGIWTFSERGADVGWLETSDSQLEFEFHGRDVGLLLRQGNFIAFLYPRLDGFTPNRVQRDSNGNPYILLRSESQQPELAPVPIAVALPLQDHTLTVIADRGWDQWVLAGYVVSDGDLSTPLLTIRTLAWGIALATLAGLVFSAHSTLLAGARQIAARSVRLKAATSWVLSIASSLILTVTMLLSVGDGVPAIVRRESITLIAGVVLTGGLLAFQPPALLVALACVTLFILFYHRPIIGLTLTLAYAPFFLFPVELYRFAFPIAELLLLLTVSGVLVRAAAGWARAWQSHITQFPPRYSLTLRWPDVAALGYLALGVLAFLISPDRGAAATELRTLFFEPVLFYACVRALVPRERLHLLVYGLLAGAFLVCVIGLATFITGTGVITAEGGAGRLNSVYGSPNNVALLLVRCMPFALAFAWYAQVPRLRLAWLMLASLFSVTLLFTQSMGGLLLGLPVSLVALGLLLLGRRALLPITALLTLGSVLTLLAAQISARVARLFDFTEGTNFIRLRLWESSTAMIQSQPLTGIGLDQFLTQYRGTFVKPDAIWDSQLSHPHNILLDVWLRLGVAGVAWLVLTQVWFWRTAYVAFRRSTSLQARPLLAGAMGAMAAVLAHGLVDNSLFVLDLALIFWLLLAIAAAYASPDQ